eukprot:CAMPEP_0117656430 /NCGR_PEP_ID=MMETSP0804-20121206/4800_1 /TAXON_ID=1074897 /ORGANISM="Tetraselmis astigmatica, Strain CCMP880" /LENGTH=100 /DNA_ID=CAMNT_0005462831 /DNA_START=676 /DNA_END=978 /DNA_ORIENTATION=+
MADRTARHPDSQASSIVHAPASVTHFCCFVYQLIESWKHVVSKLNLRNGFESHRSGAHTKAHNSLLAERCVEHSVITKPLPQANCAPEYPAKADILSKAQ